MEQNLAWCKYLKLMAKAFTRLNTRASRTQTKIVPSTTMREARMNMLMMVFRPHAHIWRQRRPQLIHTIKGGPDKAALNSSE